jgi:hypothetical protein
MQIFNTCGLISLPSVVTLYDVWAFGALGSGFAINIYLRVDNGQYIAGGSLAAFNQVGTHIYRSVVLRVGFFGFIENYHIAFFNFRLSRAGAGRVV